MNASVIGILVCVTACGSFPSKARTIARPDLADSQRTKITNYLAFKDGIQERAPSGISIAELSDEAYLAIDANRRTCVYLVERTWIDRDLPLSDVNATLNGMPVVVEMEQTGEKGFELTGERNVISADAIGLGHLASIRVTQPTKEAYSIVVRSGLFCAPLPPSASVTFSLTRPVGHLGDMGQSFTWKIVGP